MKLAAIATALVASLSLFAGCAADNDGEGGAFAAGLRPSKPSVDDVGNIPTVPGSNNALPVVDSQHESITSYGYIESILPPVTITGLCDGCEVDVLRSTAHPGELTVLDLNGDPLCSISVDKNDSVLSTTCH